MSKSAMSKSAMTLKRFAALIASYGGDPRRWPEGERDAGIALMTENADASEIAHRAGALDQLLTSLPDPAPASDALKIRLEAIAAPLQGGGAQARRDRPAGRSLLHALYGKAALRFLPQAAGLAMAGLVGIMLGLSSLPGSAQPTLMVDTSAYFFGDPGLDRDLEELD